jgi:microcystin-dependent protein
MAPQALGTAGGSQPHENRQPFLVLNICIALQGIFPSRN